MASCSEPSRKWMYLINHVFLPPKLPQEDDTSGPFEENLIREVLTALNDFRGTLTDAPADHVAALNAVADAITNLRGVHNFSIPGEDITVNGEALQRELSLLCKAGKRKHVQKNTSKRFMTDCINETPATNV